MPSPEEVFDDLEADHRSREAEVRLIQRLMQRDGTSNDEKSMLKRSVILLAYSHLEGFCKFALLAYTTSLNSLQVPCAAATYPVVAASLSRIFAALRNPDSKHDLFRRALPEDTQLHLSAREHIFVESYDRVSSLPIAIPDVLVDTKSNLSANILRKLLFQLGLSYVAVDQHEGSINKLLGVRNAIAHGDRLRIPKDEEVESYARTTFEVMGFLKNEVYSALKGQLYLRPAPAAPAKDEGLGANQDAFP